MAFREKFIRGKINRRNKLITSDGTEIPVSFANERIARGGKWGYFVTAEIDGDHYRGSFKDHVSEVTLRANVPDPLLAGRSFKA